MQARCIGRDRELRECRFKECFLPQRCVGVSIILEASLAALRILLCALTMDKVTEAMCVLTNQVDTTMCFHLNVLWIQMFYKSKRTLNSRAS